jgi:hypothetical protein
MTILENLTPVKDPKEFKITAYEEDFKVFEAAVKKLNKEHKGNGEITQEVLFEHLVSPLRKEGITPSKSKSVPKKSREKVTARGSKPEDLNRLAQ